jgi:hypothetical protein
MSTFTIKLNERSTAGKALKTILSVFAKEPGVEIVEEKSPYNPEFVAKIKKSAASKTRYTVENVDDLWKSL